MMERDIRAVLNGLTLLVDDTKAADQLQAMRNYAHHGPVRRSSEGGCHDGTWNITIIIGELDVSAK